MHSTRVRKTGVREVLGDVLLAHADESRQVASRHRSAEEHLAELLSDGRATLRR
jgi:hypothetical protein